MNGVRRAAAVLAWLPGLGFGLPCLYGIYFLAVHGTVWTFIGYPTYGYGPFDDVGIATTVPLLVAFLAVCVAEIVVGWLLWTDRPRATGLAMALLPAEFAFWIGFDLPYGPPMGLARTALLTADWFVRRAGTSKRPS